MLKGKRSEEEVKYIGVKSNELEKYRKFISFLYLNKIKEQINTYRHHKEFEMVTFNEYNNINQVLKYLIVPVMNQYL